MTKPDILVVGAYADWDRDPMADAYTLWDVDSVAKPDPLASVPASVRARIQAIAFRGHDFLGFAVIDALPELKMIANLGVGYDTIDVCHALSRGIAVSNTPDVLTEDVADLGVGMMIAWSRNIPGAQAWITSGTWPKAGEFGLQRKVSGKRAGIVGLGRIGRAVANRLVGFNMSIAYFSRQPKDTPGWQHFDDLRALAEAVDVLFVCVSGGPATAGLVSADAIEALGRKGLLINISRGTTVDEPALLDALEEGKIAGAALDVYLNEPNIDPRFLALENVLLQPHQSSGTIETRQRMGELQRENLAAFFAGAPLITPIPECA